MSRSELDVQQLGARLDAYRRRLFRMETLPAYDVASDGDDFTRWVAGEREPDQERKQAWIDVLRRERAQGRVTTRVRILTAALTEYERYSCEWGYVLNAEAGEDIRVLRHGEHRIPPGAVENQDFWLVDDAEAIAMQYEDGRFVRALVLPDDELPRLIAARDAVWEAAEPFVEWWARHPELHRVTVR